MKKEFNNKWWVQFPKSAILGGVGHVLQVLILFWLTEFGGFYYLISSTIGFVAGISVNYVLNKKYVFNEKIRDRIGRKYVQYVLVAVIALIVTLVLLYVFTEYVGTHYILSQIIAIALTFSLKFYLLKIWVFKN